MRSGRVGLPQLSMHRGRSRSMGRDGGSDVAAHVRSGRDAAMNLSTLHNPWWIFVGAILALAGVGLWELIKLWFRYV